MYTLARAPNTCEHSVSDAYVNGRHLFFPFNVHRAYILCWLLTVILQSRHAMLLWNIETALRLINVWAAEKSKPLSRLSEHC